MPGFVSPKCDGSDGQPAASFSIRPEGPNSGEGRGRVQPLRGSLAPPGATWAGISSSGVIGSIPMPLGINRMRRSSESDGSHLEIPAGPILGELVHPEAVLGPVVFDTSAVTGCLIDPRMTWLAQRLVRVAGGEGRIGPVLGLDEEG